MMIDDNFKNRNLKIQNNSSNPVPFSKQTVKKYTTPWPHYACDWSLNSDVFCNMAIASFLPSRHNYVQIISLPFAKDDSFVSVSEALTVDYVTTKLMWSPSKVKNSEYLAASGDGIYIWKNSKNGNGFNLTGRLVNKQNIRRADERLTQKSNEIINPPAPITSFDWNKLDPTLLVTASYDTTCTVWCLESGTIKTQLIAHDKEVFDVQFSPNSVDNFVSVGADGSLRLFDVRTLDHSTIIYESSDARPLLRVQWNSLDPNYLATFGLDTSQVTIMDIRMPSIPAATISDQQRGISPIVSVQWSPVSSNHILIADTNTLRICDLAEYERSNATRMISVNALANSILDSEPIQNVLWPVIASDWIGVTCPNQLSILQI